MTDEEKAAVELTREYARSGKYDTPNVRVARAAFTLGHMLVSQGAGAFRCVRCGAAGIAIQTRAFGTYCAKTAFNLNKEKPLKVS